MRWRQQLQLRQPGNTTVVPTGAGCCPGPEQDKLVARMVELFRRDAVLYAYYPKDIYLNNGWVYNTKRHGI